jgi:isoaspartyl peptidase/L-asparaginase-like protein (Ntn-hydrolase superfamily)
MRQNENFGTGTVGCVVLDSKGKIAVATSTEERVLKFRTHPQIQLL